MFLGVDGLTKSMKINLTPSVIRNHSFTSLMVSQPSCRSIDCHLSRFLCYRTDDIHDCKQRENSADRQLYLPRKYSSTSRRAQVMVGRNAAAPNANPMHAASGNALMSLLREGGQWDADDDLRAGRTNGQIEEAPYDQPRTWSLGSKTRMNQYDDDLEMQPPLTMVVSANWLMNYC
jgi:hypothetical protein